MITKTVSTKKIVISSSIENKIYSTDINPENLWLKIFDHSLKQKDKNTIAGKHMLNDRIIMMELGIKIIAVYPLTC